MKITYGRTAKSDGKTTFDVEHKWGRYTTIQDQMRMVMVRIIKKHPDAGDFDFFQWDGTQGKHSIVGGRCKLESTNT